MELGHDGIVYKIDDNLTYYIAYCPDEQISAVQLDFVYEIEELQACTFSDLRIRYRRDAEETQV
jgi:hypothetical protein